MNGGKHSGAEAQVGVRDLDPSLSDARQRVDGVADVRDVTDGLLVREGGHVNVSFVAHVNARDVLLVDVGQDPKGGKVCHGEHGLVLIDVDLGTDADVALDHDARDRRA